MALNINAEAFISDNTNMLASNFDFTDDKVIVAFTNKSSMQFKEYTAADFADIGCVSVNCLTLSTDTKMKSAVENITRNLTNNQGIDQYDGMNFSQYSKIICLELAEKSKENVLAAVEKLNTREDILFAEPNYLFEQCATIPNDPYYSNCNDIPMERVSLDLAWDITVGTTDVLVGVIDSGIDSSHSDLEDNIDEAKSRDFTSGYAQAGGCVDLTGHGTQVAGIIGAKGDNEEYIAGVCWNVSLVSLKVTNTEEATTECIAAAIEYAADRNIPIINISYGRVGLSDVISQKLALYNGLVVCSAGNRNIDTDLYNYSPAGENFDNVISVGATTWANVRWISDSENGSNYGKYTVDLFAPGYYIRTTTSSYDTINPLGYVDATGTSIAAPFVAGVAALMLSINPNLNGVQLKSLIMRGIDEIDGFDEICLSGGRLNAYKAVNSVYMGDQLEYGQYTTTAHNVYVDTCEECNCRETDGSCSECDICDPCTDCHEVFSQLHNFTVNSQTASLHVLHCNDCSQIVRSPHDWCYIATATTHTRICRDCGYSGTTTNHSFTYTDDTIYHYGTCTACVYAYAEYHNWVVVNSEYRCTICFITYEGIPPIIQQLPPDEEDLTE